MTSSTQRGARRICRPAGLALLGALWLAACGDDTVETPKLVSAVTGDPCDFVYCGGRGACVPDDGVPRCACDFGYAGARCGLCDDDFHRDAGGRCVMDDSCEEADDPCAPHGACTAPSGVVECVCREGYEGPRCRLCADGFERLERPATPLGYTCVVERSDAREPTEEDPPAPAVDPCTRGYCGDHGICDASSGTVICTCEPGHTGEGCRYCAEDYHMAGAASADDDPTACVPDETCSGGGAICGIHGICDDSSGVIACACEVGYTGEGCAECYPGFHREVGECVPDSACLPTSCGGHGRCSGVGDDVRCGCDVGYTGDACETCDWGFHRDAQDQCVANEVCQPSSCGPAGTCNAMTGVIQCLCDDGYRGPACKECAAGFHDDGGGACVLDTLCLPSSCPTHAICDDNGGVVTCTCEAGYEESTCDICAPGYLADGDICMPNTCATVGAICGANGQCDDAGGAPVCVCDPGYVGEACASCAPGYHEDAELCARDTTCLATSCDGHGACTDGVDGGPVRCDCDAGYDGSSCERCGSGFGRAGEICRPCQSGTLDFFAFPVLFPESQDTCLSNDATHYESAQYQSIGGDGTVWACAGSTIYPMTTRHIFLEAGDQLPAQIVFDAPIISIVLRYSARRKDVVLDALADGELLETFSAPKGKSSELTFEFERPISVFAIRNSWSGIAQVAIDQVSFELAECSP